MEDAVMAEMKLRQGQGNDTLSDVRTHLITLTTLKKQQELAEGQALTRFQGAVNREMKARNDAAEGYWATRNALRTLKPAESRNNFPELTEWDLKIFNFKMVHQALGDSRRSPSWIWGDFGFVDS